MQERLQHVTQGAMGKGMGDKKESNLLLSFSVVLSVVDILHFSRYRTSPHGGYNHQRRVSGL